MKNKLTQKNLALIAIFVSRPLFANSLEFSQKLPHFYKNLLSEVYQSKKISADEIKNINKKLNQISPSTFNYLDVEVTKYVLAYSENLTKGYKLVDQKMYDLTKQSLEKIPSSKPFSKYLYESLLIDLGELLTDEEYINYTQYLKNKKSKLQPKTKVFKRKVALLTRWLHIVHNKPTQELNDQLDILSIQVFDHLQKVLNIFVRTARLNEDKKAQVTYIKVSDTKFEQAKSEIDQLTFEVSPQPDPSYVPPKELPKAVDIWVPVDEDINEDGAPLTKDNLFPEPDPDYTPPKVLPKPVDDWTE